MRTRVTESCLWDGSCGCGRERTCPAEWRQQYTASRIPHHHVERIPEIPFYFSSGEDTTSEPPIRIPKAARPGIENDRRPRTMNPCETLVDVSAGGKKWQCVACPGNRLAGTASGFTGRRDLNFNRTDPPTPLRTNSRQKDSPNRALIFLPQSVSVGPSDDCLHDQRAITPAR